jgi:signal peptidase
MTAGNAGPDDDTPDDRGESEFESSPSLDSPSLDSGIGSSPNATDGERDEPQDATSQSFLERFMTAEHGPLMFVRETASSVGVVLIVGLLLFTVSGVWPPMVAVESGSMEPHMEKGDLVFISTPGRYVPDAAYEDTGVVTYRTGAEIEYRSFGDYGSVIVYDNPSRFGPPVIHRARFWVDEGENWYDQTDPDYVRADNCEELLNCPAPNAGFVTKGDANDRYDQANGISEPVRPRWITGVAMVRIPYLGWVRLWLANLAPMSPSLTAAPGAQFAADPPLSVAAGTANVSGEATIALASLADETPRDSAAVAADRRCDETDTGSSTPIASGGTRAAERSATGV